MKAYQLIVLSFIVLVSFSACKKKADDTIPTEVFGKTFEGTITTGTGPFAEMIGHHFVSNFKSATEFQTKTMSGKIEDQGSYQYRLTTKDQAELRLTATKGEAAGQEVVVTLKFTSPRDGVFEGRVVKGENGDYNGIFSLR